MRTITSIQIAVSTPPEPSAMTTTKMPDSQAPR